MINELDLPTCHLTQLLTFHAHTSIFHSHIATFIEVSARLATLELSGIVERVADGYQRRVA